MKFEIGSVAAKKIFADFKREPFDLDILVNEDYSKFRSVGKVEYVNIPPLYNYIIQNGKKVTGDILLTLKCSHIFWPIKWDKTIFDICFFIKHDCKIIKSLFFELYEFWNIKHGENIRINLKVTAENFFDNDLKNYDHDYLHTLVNPSPTYFKVLKDNAEVEVCEEKFNLLSYEDKLNLVREEIYIMAFERRDRKNKHTYAYRSEYSKMFKKFIMEHAPMWEALFILQNYITLSQPEFNYIKTLENELSRNC